MKLFILFMAAVLLTGCAAKKDNSTEGWSEATVAETTTTTETTETTTVTTAAVNDNRTYIAEWFYYCDIDENVQSRIIGVSYPKEGAKIGIDELSYVQILHYDFNGEVKVGELIVNDKLAKEVTEIFYELYKEKYPIASVKLVDEYGGDDETSMAANNTSMFNYRTVEGTNTLSMHGMGAAIDINPLYNPCVEKGDISPANGEPYADRSKDFPGKIDENDLAYKLFTKAGWTWGGHWNSLKDYQHFQKRV